MPSLLGTAPAPQPSHPVSAAIARIDGRSDIVGGRYPGPVKRVHLALQVAPRVAAPATGWRSTSAVRCVARSSRWALVLRSAPWPMWNSIGNRAQPLLGL